ncbi:GNAT family N-acetyltransferase [Williamsia sp.]|uniref:GNAT family N-acetyltransferase n=1 Tax=Williamsia sp. TaxID=1872085 RepID=UPI002F925D7D
MTNNSETITDKTGAPVTIADDPDHRRYTVSVDGVRAGLAAYADRTDDHGVAQRVFYHTEVDEAFGGRGLATILVNEALDDARARGKKIVGVCPLVAAFLKKHPEYSDATNPVTKQILDWLRR